MAIAELDPAAPPTMARKTMPMKTGDMPSASPVPSAAPTRISLIHAASSDATTRLADRARQAPARASCASASSDLSSGLPANSSGVGLQHEHEVQRVGDEQHHGEPDVEQRLCAHRLLGAKKRLKALGTIRLNAAISIIEL